jgi:hypothetical protein
MSDLKKKINNDNTNIRTNDKDKNVNFIGVKNKPTDYYNKNDFFYNSDGIGFDMDSNEHIIQKN